MSILTLGSLLALLGLAGLVLPVLQGTLILLLAAALLSAVSPRVDRIVRRLLCPWPPVWRQMARMRRWLAVRLSPP